MIGLAMEGNDKQPGKLSLASAEIENVATNATPVPSIDRIDLRDFIADIPTDDGNKSGERITVAVAHAGYEAPGLVIGRLPAKATLSIDHAVFDVPPDSGAAPMLLAMGYKRLDLSSESRSRYDAAGQMLDLGSALDHRHRHGYTRHQARPRQSVGGDRVAERRGGRRLPPPRWSSRPWI